MGTTYTSGNYLWQSVLPQMYFKFTRKKQFLQRSVFKNNINCDDLQQEVETDVIHNNTLPFMFF